MRFFFRLMLLVAFTLCLGVAQAQSYPSKSIRMVVPFPPGGGTDVTARLLAQKLGERLGQSVIVENVSGAGGKVGTAAVAKAAPDGYTLLVGQTGPNTIAPSLYANLGYDAENDFASITNLIRMPLFLVVPAASPYKTLGDLVADGKKRTDLNYASAGLGTLGHLTAELFNTLAGTRFAIIPYRGSAPALTALLSGDASFHFAAGVDALPQMTSGRMRALAVVGDSRTSLAPEVPSATEAGVPGLTANLWYGLLAPAKTPRAIVERLHNETVRILKEPDVQARFVTLSAEAAPTSPEELDMIIKNDIAKYARIVKAAGIKVE